MVRFHEILPAEMSRWGSSRVIVLWQFLDFVSVRYACSCGGGVPIFPFSIFAKLVLESLKLVFGQFGDGL